MQLNNIEKKFLVQLIMKTTFIIIIELFITKKHLLY